MCLWQYYSADVSLPFSIEPSVTSLCTYIQTFAGYKDNIALYLYTHWLFTPWPDVCHRYYEIGKLVAKLIWTILLCFALVQKNINQKLLKSSITVNLQEQVRSSMSVVYGNIALLSRKILWVFHETWRRHQMEPFSALPGLYEGNSSVTSQRPVFFDLRLNKLLSKQSICWWFKTPTHSLWHHYNNETPKTMNLQCARRGFVLSNRCYR